VLSGLYKFLYFYLFLNSSYRLIGFLGQESATEHMVV
jgi:hypothetical protein